MRLKGIAPEICTYRIVGRKVGNRSQTVRKRSKYGVTVNRSLFCKINVNVVTTATLTISIKNLTLIRGNANDITKILH